MNRDSLDQIQTSLSELEDQVAGIRQTADQLTSATPEDVGHVAIFCEEARQHAEAVLEDIRRLPGLTARAFLRVSPAWAPCGACGALLPLLVGLLNRGLS